MTRRAAPARQSTFGPSRNAVTSSLYPNNSRTRCARDTSRTVRAYTVSRRSSFESGVLLDAGRRYCAMFNNPVDSGATGFPLKISEHAIDRYPSSADWGSWLLSGIHFVPGVLSEADQKLLFVLWVLTLFFPQLFPTRIILALIGEKGSGKSSLLRRVGQLLFGPKFNVSALTGKPDDFDAAITTDPLVIADNADDAPSWFPDKLAVLATGGAIKRRILYTTNKLGEFPIVANVAVTSRTPNFTREDVAERLLPLNVQRIESFEPESALLADLLQRRDQIVSAIAVDVRSLPWERGNPRSFGQYFRTRKGTLRSLYDMTERQGHAGATVVSFHHHRRSGDLGDLGDQQSYDVSRLEEGTGRTGRQQ